MTHGRNSQPYSPTQCAFAMRELLERIVREGYVRDERADELLDRARNMERGHGFFTTAELRARQTTTEEELLS